MKKILCMIIAVAIVMTASVSVAFAQGSEHRDGVYGGKTVDYSNFLAEQMSQYHKDKNKMKDLIKKLRDYQKQSQKLENLKREILAFVNGTEIKSDVPPVIKDGRTLVPVRALTTALGADVSWDQASRTVTIKKGDNTIILKLDSNKYTLNGKEYTLDVPAGLMQSRVVVPIRFIAQAFGQKVEWDEETGSVIIEDGDDNDGSTTPAPNPAVVSVNDSATGTAANQFQFVGNWTYETQAGAYSNDDHFAVDTDVYYQVAFNGTQIKVYSAAGPDFGLEEITVDGANARTIDCYNSTRTDNVLLYTSPVLSAGQHVLKVRVTGQKNSSSSGYKVSADRVEITPAAASTNLAQGKTAVASSSYDSGSTADKAVDGDSTTRWSSQFNDNEWIYVDLGSTQTIKRVKLDWETAYAKAYTIQVSNDATNWTNVYATTTGDGGSDEVTVNPVSARYVKVLGGQRGTEYGYSLYEIGVYAN